MATAQCGEGPSSSEITRREAGRREKMAQPRAHCPAALCSGREVKTSKPRERQKPRTEGA
eukprot:14188536-Alexandrium_andersonii.AAC.1